MKYRDTKLYYINSENEALKTETIKILANSLKDMGQHDAIINGMTLNNILSANKNTSESDEPSPNSERESFRR